MSTSKDVAALAGVSPTTVSRVFRGDTNVKAETVETVLKAAEKLNYVPNYFASVLKQQKSKIIVIIISDINNPFYMIVANKIGEYIKSQGYNFLISYDNEDVDALIENLKLFISFQVGCIIFSPVDSQPPSQTIKRIIKGHAESHFLQLYSEKYSGVDSITYDDEYGMYVGMKYLLENNHRKILVVSGADRNRFKGCMRAYKEFGIDEPKIALNTFCEESLFDDIDRVITRMKPTAIFGVGNKSGSIVYEVLKKKSLKIYDNISFLMYDDLDWVKILDISAIAHPITAVAVSAAELAIRFSYGEVSDKEAVSIKHKPFLIKRKSVKCI